MQRRWENSGHFKRLVVLFTMGLAYSVCPTYGEEILSIDQFGTALEDDALGVAVHGAEIYVGRAYRRYAAWPEQRRQF